MPPGATPWPSRRATEPLARKGEAEHARSNTRHQYDRGRARSVDVSKEQMTLTGMASTMPCKVIVSRQEVGQLIRLLANWRVIRFALSALFVRAEK